MFLVSVVTIVDDLQNLLSAVAYIRTQKQDDIFQTSFLLGKCKVATIKQISVPKLELEAAVLGTRLRTLIETEMTLEFEKAYLWTDSRVVLDWISSTKKQNVFVSNRLKEIKKTTKTDEWNHVPTNFNPIQPTMERVALSHQKSPRNGLQHHNFCKTLKVLGNI